MPSTILTQSHICEAGHQLNDSGTSGGERGCIACRQYKVRAYNRQYQKTDKSKERLKRYRRTEVGKYHLRQGAIRHYFGENREIAIVRDGEKCVSCSMTRLEHRERYGVDITVDHIDGRGRYTKKQDMNNDIDNLQTLCLKCHGRKDSLRRWRGVGTL